MTPLVRMINNFFLVQIYVHNKNMLNKNIKYTLNEKQTDIYILLSVYYKYYNLNLDICVKHL